MENHIFVNEIQLKKRIREAENVLPAANKVSELFAGEKINFSDEHLKGFLSGSTDYLVGILGNMARAEIARMDIKLDRLKQSLLKDATDIDTQKVKKIHSEFYKAMSESKVVPANLEVTKSGEIRLKKSFLTEIELQFTVDLSHPANAEMWEHINVFCTAYNRLQSIVEERGELSLHESLDPRYGSFYTELPGNYPRIAPDANYFLGFNGYGVNTGAGHDDHEQTNLNDPTTVKLNI